MSARALSRASSHARQRRREHGPDRDTPHGDRGRGPQAVAGGVGLVNGQHPNSALMSRCSRPARAAGLPGTIADPSSCCGRWGLASAARIEPGNRAAARWAGKIIRRRAPDPTRPTAAVPPASGESRMGRSWMGRRPSIYPRARPTHVPGDRSEVRLSIGWIHPCGQGTLIVSVLAGAKPGYRGVVLSGYRSAPRWLRNSGVGREM